MQLGTLEIQNTKDLLGPDTRLCALLYTAAKFGKTELASGLNDICLKYRGKPCLFIAVEAAEGGGTMTLASKGISYVTPKNWTEMEGVLASLASDSTFGGVVLDNSTDYVARIVKPHALAMPNKKEIALQHMRAVGVPARSDYQTMGEAARGHMNKLINLTNRNTDPKFRKDLIVTALERKHENDDGSLAAITPDLPGALAGSVTAMFQSVIGIKISPRVVKQPDGTTLRVSGRVLNSEADGIRVAGDRTGIFKNGYSLTGDDGKAVGLFPMYASWLQQFS